MKNYYSEIFNKFVHCTFNTLSGLLKLLVNFLEFVNTILNSVHPKSNRIVKFVKKILFSENACQKNGRHLKNNIRHENVVLTN